MAFFDIALQTTGSLHPCGEPSENISEYTGFIRYTRDRDDKTFRVGKVHAWRIHAGLAQTNGESVFDVCDAHSQDLHDVYSAVFDREEDDLKEAIRYQFDSLDSDVLVLDYVVLHPKWRGLKLGLLVARKLIDMLGGGCALVVADIQPLNPDAHGLLKIPLSWLPSHEDDDELRVARRKLRRYYRNLGFERVKPSRFYGLSLSRRAPTLAEIIKARRAKE